MAGNAQDSGVDKKRLEDIGGGGADVKQAARERVHSRLLGLRNNKLISDEQYRAAQSRTSYISGLDDATALAEVDRLLAGPENEIGALRDIISPQISPRQQAANIVERVARSMFLDENDILAIETDVNNRLKNKGPDAQDELLRRMVADGDLASLVENRIAVQGNKSFEQGWSMMLSQARQRLSAGGLGSDYLGAIMVEMQAGKEDARTDFLDSFLTGVDTIQTRAQDVQSGLSGVGAGFDPSATAAELYRFRETAATNWLTQNRLGLLRAATPAELRDSIPPNVLGDLDLSTDAALAAYTQAVGQQADRGASFLSYYDAQIKRLETAALRAGNPRAAEASQLATSLSRQRSGLLRSYLVSESPSPVDFVAQVSPEVFAVAGAPAGTGDLAATVEGFTEETPEETAAGEAKTDLASKRADLKTIATDPRRSARQRAAAQRELDELGTATVQPGATPTGAPAPGATSGPKSVLDEPSELDIPPELEQDYEQFRRDVSAGFGRLLEPGELDSPTLREYVAQHEGIKQSHARGRDPAALPTDVTSLNLSRANTRHYYYNRFQVVPGQPAPPAPGTDTAAAPAPTIPPQTVVVPMTPPAPGQPGGARPTATVNFESAVADAEEKKRKAGIV